MSAESPPPRRRRRKVIIAAVVVAAYAITGFFILPPVVKSQAIKTLSAQLKRDVAIEKVAINPFALSVTVRGLSVTDHDNAELAGFDEFYANFQLSSLFRRTWYFSEIRLERPRGRLVMARDRTLNIADLIPGPPPESAAAQPSAALPRFLIGLLEVNGGSLQFRDLSSAQVFENNAGPVTVTLRNFGAGTGDAGGISLQGNTESGERFSFEGLANLDALTLSGRWIATGVHVPKYDPLHHRMTLFEVADGKISFDVRFLVDLHDGLAVRVDPADLAIEDLHIRARGEQTDAIYIPSIMITGVRADTATHIASVERIAVGPFSAVDAPEWAWRAANPDETAPGVARFKVTRLSDGSIDLAMLMTPRLDDEAATDSAAGESAPAWSASIAEAMLADTTIDFTDLSNERPVHVLIDQLSASASGISSDGSVEVPFEARLRWQEKGIVAVKGTASREPLHAQADITVAGLALPAIDPYLGPWLDARITAGSARADGSVTVVRDSSEADPALTFSGTAGLDDLSLATPDGTPVAGLGSLDLRDIHFASPPVKIDIAEVVVASPTVTVDVAKDGAINLQSILRAGGPADESPREETEPPAGPRPRITIGKVTISDGRADLADHSLPGEYKSSIREFGGTIAGMSSENLARADVDLHGSINGSAPFRVTGTINPLSENAFTDLRVDSHGIGLPQFTPYSGKFIGYEIDRGRLSLNLRYHLSSRVLEAENDLAFDNFYLGDTVESPDAMHLPVKLALGLLRDRDGKIDIDLPIEGSLDDPDFRYGKLVWKAVGNIIAKAATAPFSLLGKLIPAGKSDEMGYVEFAAGSAALDGASSDKLGTLANVLYERPALSLAITSVPAPGPDTPVLRAARFAAQLKERKLADLSAAGTPAADPASVTVAPNERPVLIREEFAAAFPDEVAIPEAPGQAAAGSESTTSKPGFFKRTIRRIFGTGEEPGPEPVEPAVEVTGPGLEEMESRLIGRIEISTDELAALASKRAEIVRDQLLSSDKVEAGRLEIVANGEGTKPERGGTVRVNVDLK